jgi:hypothetical protein
MIDTLNALACRHWRVFHILIMTSTGQMRLSLAEAAENLGEAEFCY